MKYSNDIQGTIKLQKFCFRIKLTKFFVRKLSPVGLYMAAHALLIVSQCVVCGGITTMAQSTLMSG